MMPTELDSAAGLAKFFLSAGISSSKNSHPTYKTTPVVYEPTERQGHKNRAACEVFEPRALRKALMRRKILRLLRFARNDGVSPTMTAISKSTTKVPVEGRETELSVDL